MIMLFSPPPVRICEHLSAPGEARALHEPSCKTALSGEQGASQKTAAQVGLVVLALYLQQLNVARAHLRAAVADFRSRERRFGGLCEAEPLVAAE
jgi:hypothetical protein